MASLRASALWLSLARLTLVAAAVSATADFARAQPQADMRIVRQALNDAMTLLGPDQEQFWENPATGNFGTVRPGGPASAGADGRLCRDFIRTWTYDGSTSTLRGSACRDPNGLWRLQDETQVTRTAASPIPPPVNQTVVQTPVQTTEPTAPVVLGRLPNRATLR